MRRLLAQIATWLGTGLATLVIGTRLVLDLIGYSTSPEDAEGVPEKAQLVLNFIATQPGILIYGVPALLIAFGALTLWPHHAPPAPPTPNSGQSVFPDWKLSDLLAYLRPDLPIEPQGAWMPTLRDVEDRFSTGQLDAWARKRLPAGSAARSSLEKIDPTYWKDADVLAWSANPDWAGGVHTRRRSNQTEWEYSDLRVNKAQALAVWPEPLAKPRPVERDKKLEEAIGYLMFQEWGRDVYKDTGDQVPLLGEALRRFHQLAADGEMKVWARREPNHGVYELIPADFWKTNHVDILDLLGEPPPKTSKMGSDLQFGVRHDPMVSAVETEKSIRAFHRREGVK